MLTPMHCFPHLFSVTQKIINKQHHKNQILSLSTCNKKTNKPRLLRPPLSKKNTLVLMNIFQVISFQHLNFILFHLLESTITLDLQHYFLSTIEQTKKTTTKCPLHKFSTFFPIIYNLNIFLLFLFGTMEKKCLSSNSITKIDVPCFTLYYLNMLVF